MVIFGQNGVVWYPSWPHKSLKKLTERNPSARKKSFWYFFYHQWSKMSSFKKPSKNFFSSRKVTFGHFFEKNFCPRWQVENSTLTLKFWALRSKRVKRSFGARITLVMVDCLNFKIHLSGFKRYGRSIRWIWIHYLLSKIVLISECPCTGQVLPVRQRTLRHYRNHFRPQFC